MGWLIFKLTSKIIINSSRELNSIVKDKYLNIDLNSEYLASKLPGK